MSEAEEPVYDLTRAVFAAMVYWSEAKARAYFGALAVFAAAGYAVAKPGEKPHYPYCQFHH